MTLASGGVYLLPVVVQVALGAGLRSFGEHRGPLGASRHQPEEKEGPFGKKGGQGGLRAGEASGVFEEGPTAPDSRMWKTLDPQDWQGPWWYLLFNLPRSLLFHFQFFLLFY